MFSAALLFIFEMKKSVDVDAILTSTVAKPLLPRRINFVRATRPDKTPFSTMAISNKQSVSIALEQKTPQESTPRTLFPRVFFAIMPTNKSILQEAIWDLLEWKTMRKIGAGLGNMGNTCFLNSVLQCLTYTPPLANYLMSNKAACPCITNQ